MANSSFTRKHADVEQCSRAKPKHYEKISLATNKKTTHNFNDLRIKILIEAEKEKKIEVLIFSFTLSPSLFFLSP